MKRLLLSLIMLVALFASAQGAKRRIAVLDVANRGGQVLDATVVLCRTAMRQAIESLPDYELCSVSDIRMDRKMIVAGTPSERTLAMLRERYALDALVLSSMQYPAADSIRLTMRLFELKGDTLSPTAVETVELPTRPLEVVVQGVMNATTSLITH